MVAVGRDSAPTVDGRSRTPTLKGVAENGLASGHCCLFFWEASLWAEPSSLVGQRTQVVERRQVHALKGLGSCSLRSTFCRR